nr:reverse transcriptase domain-containing protein [Tanacetum cinerariifolium]
RGAHSYYQCLAAGGNTFPEFRDNIQEYVLAAATNYNQGNPGYRPQGFANQMEPPGMDECLALADFGASINLMPLSMWKELKKLSLPELSPTCMTLELADRLISHPTGRALIDVYEGELTLRFGKEATGRALIDVYEGELTLRFGKEAVTFNLDQTSRYSVNYDAMPVNRIDLIDLACEEYS